VAITVKINGDDSDLQKKLNNATKSIAKWSAAAIAGATAAAAAMVKSGIDSADALVKQAAALHTTAKDLTTLKRAADLSGISQEQLNTAIRTLTVGLGQATNGTGTAVKALDKLGVSASELSKMSTTEQMSLLTTKIKEVIPAAQQASVAADLFGSRSALAMANLSAGDIATATEEVNKFSVALTDIQYAQIEQAGDAISQMDLAYQSVTQQLAAAFAPALQGVAELLGDAASESGLFSGAIQDAVDYGVKGAGWLGNAWRGFNYIILGLKGTFYGLQVGAASVIEAILQGFQDMKQGAANAINTLIDGANNLPGVNIERIIVGQSEALQSITKFKNDANVEFATIADEIRELAATPLPSEQFDAWIENAKQKSEEMAKVTAENRKKMLENSKTENLEESESPELIKQKEETAKILEEMQNRFKSEEELLLEKYNNEYIALYESLELKLLTQQEFDALMLENNQYYQDKLTEIETKAAEDRKKLAEAEMKAKLAVAKNTFGNIAALMDSGSRKAFEVGKAAAIAEATVKGFEGVQAAWSAGMSIGTPAAPAFAAAYAASAALTSAMQINKIKSTQFGGGSGGGGSSASASVPSVPSAEASAPTPQVANITLQGSMFSRESVIGLMEEMNELMADGVRLNVK
jgi:hypothetical protein